MADRILNDDMWEWFKTHPKSNLNLEIGGRPYQRVTYRRIIQFGRIYDTVQWKGTILFMRYVGPANNNPNFYYNNRPVRGTVTGRTKSE